MNQHGEQVRIYGVKVDGDGFLALDRERAGEAAAKAGDDDVRDGGVLLRGGDAGGREGRGEGGGADADGEGMAQLRPGRAFHSFPYGCRRMSPSVIWPGHVGPTGLLFVDGRRTWPTHERAYWKGEDFKRKRLDGSERILRLFNIHIWNIIPLVKITVKCVKLILFVGAEYWPDHLSRTFGHSSYNMI